MSCFTSFDCEAVDGAGNVIIAGNENGWRAAPPMSVDPGQKLTDVSCVARATGTQGTDGFCAAVDDRGQAVVSSDPLAGQRSSWSAPAAISGGIPLGAVACPSTSLCAPW